MKNQLVFILLISCFHAIDAQYPQQPAQSLPALPSVRIMCGPWLQAVSENEFTVLWITNMDAAAWVEVAPDDGSNFYAQERPKYYQSVYGKRAIGRLHRVRVTGLAKGTTYRYRILQQAVLLNEGNKRVILGEGYGNDILHNQPYTVTTLNREKEEIKFTMINDIHGNDSIFRLLTKGIKDSNTDFVVFNGDMLTQIESEDQIINGYLRSASELFASEIPVFALRGNHENRGMFSYEFFNYFPNLANNAYYSFRHGPAYFICLDCGEDKPDSDIRYYGLSTSDEMRKEEAGWLQEIVDKKEFKAAPIKIVIIHMQPTGMWHGNLEIERLFMPILNKAGIDLMLCGHVHKHLFIEAGSGNKFPIAINSNIWRTDVRVTSSGIKINFVDASNNVTETYSVKK